MVLCSNLSGSLGGPRTGSSYFFSVASVHACMEIVWYCTQEVAGMNCHKSPNVCLRETVDKHARTLPRRWSIRSKSREMATMAEQTEATIHVGVYSSVISVTPPPAASPPPPAMMIQASCSTVPYPSPRFVYSCSRECQNGWFAANKVASSWSIYNGPGPIR